MLAENGICVKRPVGVPSPPGRHGSLVFDAAGKEDLKGVCETCRVACQPLRRRKLGVGLPKGVLVDFQVVAGQKVVEQRQPGQD